MAGSSFGRLLKLTSFGESHGKAIGGILDGFPSNFTIDLIQLQKFVDKRKPGQSKIVTQRKEADEIQFLSGLLNNVTLGTPIAFMVENTNAKPKDYQHIEDKFRPSHADWTYQQKYGIRDVNGGGRSSARETVARVIAGGLCLQFLAEKGITIQAFTEQIGKTSARNKVTFDFSPQESDIEANIVRCPFPTEAKNMIDEIESARKNGDSLGGTVFCRVTGLPAGLGEPVFDKLNAVLGQAMLSINAVRAIEFGTGFSATTMSGSEHNDPIKKDGRTESNHAGGIVGGISNGMPIDFRVAFKPTATILKSQSTINSENEETTTEGKGRHDPCVVPRAVPIIEAMAALTILDFYLIHQAYK